MLSGACGAGADIPPPAIGAITPNSATPGTLVTIAGDHFCHQPDTGEDQDPLACANVGTVAFGATSAAVAMYTEMTISAEVPSLPAGNVDVSVTVAGQRSNRVAFDVVGP
jgi:uncharacterized protein (TIGR03437 family)